MLLVLDTANQPIIGGGSQGLVTITSTVLRGVSLLNLSTLFEICTVLNVAVTVWLQDLSGLLFFLGLCPSLDLSGLFFFFRSQPWMVENRDVKVLIGKHRLILHCIMSWTSSCKIESLVAWQQPLQHFTVCWSTTELFCNAWHTQVTALPSSLLRFFKHYYGLISLNHVFECSEVLWGRIVWHGVHVGTCAVMFSHFI